MKKAKKTNGIVKTAEPVKKEAVIVSVQKPVVLTDITFESIHRQEHFRIGEDKFRFRNYKLTIYDCSEELKSILLAKPTIKLSK